MKRIPPGPLLAVIAILAIYDVAMTVDFIRESLADHGSHCSQLDPTKVGGTDH
ncbi:hypothetical protein [Nocardia miyunensis]|uniref:hypothetical protein n=1 Tax=Nocardia miyunensis TaxID=282684 RepID=UPI000A7DFA40|nr:hypothetical protein [Nocardia miyunensis]